MNSYETAHNFDNVIKLVFKRLINSFNKRKEQEITLEQFFLLDIINNHPEINQNELSQIACKDKSAVVRQVDILENKEIVNRKTCPLDRRKNKMMMTDKGCEIFKKGNEFKDDFLNQILEVLSEEEKKELNKILLKLLKSLND